MRRAYWFGLILLALAVAGCTGGGGGLTGSTEYSLTVRVGGEGQVEPNEGTHWYHEITPVDLHAAPDDDWVFVQWIGNTWAADQANHGVIVDRHKTVEAVFAMAPKPEIDAAGKQTTHKVGNLDVHMRLAPAAVSPGGIADDGTAVVDRPFWIAETPVTYALWYMVRQWAVEKGYSFSSQGGEGSHGDTGAEPTLKDQEPVTRVNWQSCIVWTNALSEMLGLDPVYTYQGSVIRNTSGSAIENAVQEDTNGFRLPTNDEWELAARYRGEDGSHGAIRYRHLYWTPGNHASGATAAVDNSTATKEVAWYSGNSDGGTRDVGLKRANALGLYDMSGNVWEWCFDEHRVDHLYRGGSWQSDPNALRIGVSAAVATVSSDVGFRLARNYTL